MDMYVLIDVIAYCTGIWTLESKLRNYRNKRDADFADMRLSREHFASYSEHARGIARH